MAKVRGVVFLAPLFTGIFLLVARFLDFQELFDNRTFHVAPHVCVYTKISMYEFIVQTSCQQITIDFNILILYDIKYKPFCFPVHKWPIGRHFLYSVLTWDVHRHIKGKGFEGDTRVGGLEVS